jgi:DNA repair exonuclease SbcCD ATPase subunit
MISNRKKEIEDVKKQGICPVLKTPCASLGRSITPELEKKMSYDISQWLTEIEQYQKQLENELDAMVYYDLTLNKLQNEEQKARQCLMKLREAMKFKDYKYTKQDVMLYDESIKVLDAFSGYYINEWLGQLSLIMNGLLQNVNLKVEFSPEKDFIRIKDGDNSLPYELLSDGQKTFLSAVFRLSILIHKGDNSGLIICDEGLGNLDEKNFVDFIDVCKNTNFQFLVVYQDAPEIDGVNYITIRREKGISKVE